MKTINRTPELILGLAGGMLGYLTIFITAAVNGLIANTRWFSPFDESTLIVIGAPILAIVAASLVTINNRKINILSGILLLLAGVGMALGWAIVFFPLPIIAGIMMLARK